MSAKSKGSAILGVVEYGVINILKCSLGWLKRTVMPSLTSSPSVIVPQSIKGPNLLSVG